MTLNPSSMLAAAADVVAPDLSMRNKAGAEVASTLARVHALALFSDCFCASKDSTLLVIGPVSLPYLGNSLIALRYFRVTTKCDASSPSLSDQRPIRQATLITQAPRSGRDAALQGSAQGCLHSPELRLSISPDSSTASKSAPFTRDN